MVGAFEDARHKPIGIQVVTNVGSDLGKLAPIAITAEGTPGVVTLLVVADRG